MEGFEERNRELEGRVREAEDALANKERDIEALLNKSRLLEQELRNQADQNRFLYDFAPVALSELDCSGLKEYLDGLKKGGIPDLRSYLECHPETVRECAAKLELCDANHAMVRLFHAENKQELLEKFGDVFAEGAIEDFTEGLVAFAEGRDHLAAEVPVRTFDGEMRSCALTWSFVPGCERSRERMLGALIDVTDLRRTELELSIFKTISDKANVGSAISDMEGKFIYINEAFARMQGYTIDEVIGKHYSLFHTPEQMNFFNSTTDLFFQEGHITNAEIMHIRKDGSVFPTLMNATVVRNEKSDTYVVSTTAIDISRIHEMQAELEAQNRRLEEANIALRVVIRNGEKERADMEHKVVSELSMLAARILKKLRKTGLNSEQSLCVGDLESSLQSMVGPLAEGRASKFPKLNSTEAQIATLINQGKSTKEIAAILCLAKKTIDTHREHIREKLGIKNKKITLRNFIASQ